MTQKISKILIANRGEIACRVIKTARKMGIATVAIYSDADRKALHVRMADEAVHIGPSPAIESYLVIEKIIQAAKDSGANAVHPGYGFLSENPDFVRACDKAGIIFIGPSPESMEAMGLKDAAKKLMDAAGVPTTPGYHGEDQNPKTLRAKAEGIGYPVLIKAVAGGGGKGMRKVEADADFEAALASCQREAKASFGNDQVLIEKYITSPRHIEVQVFGDSHGNVVHMYERDCSLQRRHQKVVEEAPAPGMTEAVRKAMTDAAINAAKAVDYVGAGTVEFIVDGSGALRTDGFWFMEMNTRLQVEHPVSEMITGYDFVELQIRVAQGEALPVQTDITMTGHAVETRLYAEDPANDFLPSIGTLWGINTENWQSDNDYEGGYRIDSGVEAGNEISIYYDPMIAKIIGYALTRDEAISNTSLGITEIEASGLNNNSAFLMNCLNHEDFKAEKLSTAFIPDRQDALIGMNINLDDRSFALAALFMKDTSEEKFEEQIFGDNLQGWRLNIPAQFTQTFISDDEEVTVRIIEDNEYFARVKVGTSHVRIEHGAAEDPLQGSLAQDVSTSLNYYDEWSYSIREDHVSLHRQGVFGKVFFPQYNTEKKASGNALTAPMPGKIIAVKAKAGDNVKAGDPLIIMEAMKMEMTLEAPRDGIVATVNTDVDALVADGDVLLALEIETEDGS